MHTETTKLFTVNNELIDTFELEVENVLKSIHGDNYYDIDEEFIIKEEISKQEKNENNLKIKKRISIKDFIPLLFFILIFIIIVIGGYYFLNHFDITSIMKGI